MLGIRANITRGIRSPCRRPLLDLLNTFIRAVIHSDSIRYGVISLFSVLVIGCSTQPVRQAEVADFQREHAEQARIDDLNQQLVLQSQDISNKPDNYIDSYRLGADDLVEVKVLGVDELSREVRVDGNGIITLPLIGDVAVGGRTVAEAGELVAARYEESYLQDPQISLLVKEHRSMRVTVLGAVMKPEVYAVQRKVNVIEALALAGGLTKGAGRTVYVNDRVTDAESGERIGRNLILDMENLLQGGAEAKNIILGDGAVVNVPEAGVVYVEGAVVKPGLYPLQKETSVLKAITMAGGLEFEAEGSSIRVLRLAGDGGTSEPIENIDINYIREYPEADIKLEDGDVIVVAENHFKSLLSGIVNLTKGIVGFGYSLNR